MATGDSTRKLNGNHTKATNNGGDNWRTTMTNDDDLDIYSVYLYTEDGELLDGVRMAELSAHELWAFIHATGDYLARPCSEASTAILRCAGCQSFVAIIDRDDMGGDFTVHPSSEYWQYRMENGNE